jgi:hypothetical protein
MEAELCKAYQDALDMLEDGIRKTPAERWRNGYDDYLSPARIAYHILKGLEWLTNELPREEFLRNRRFSLDWLGPMEAMPEPAALLEDLGRARARVEIWLTVHVVEGQAGAQTREKALYHLRHMQHHVGEYGVIARLGGYPEPEWM